MDRRIKRDDPLSLGKVTNLEIQRQRDNDRIRVISYTRGVHLSTKLSLDSGVSTFRAYDILMKLPQVHGGLYDNSVNDHITYEG
jgi:hypothetical protein